ncbi:hypothetical protein BV22DRAFT_1199135 [Leucogyrophana mollusca]|uniref:Uncharacterized protein n=1 Tax=Leucogyrophana mollusca TaxID=85980 RepID=A0ACB8B5X0_9AGAM|nr:hypothetical protein BV22DRAFT_1199135 [Leucogyrophana mollusca]
MAIFVVKMFAAHLGTNHIVNLIIILVAGSPSASQQRTSSKISLASNTLFKPVEISKKQRDLLVQAGEVELPLHLDKATGMIAKVFWPEDLRTRKPDILEKVDDLAKGNPNVDGHIPELLWHTFDNSTAELRKALGTADAGMGSRTLYSLVIQRLSPITELSGAEFLSAWWDCVLCHRELWKGGVHHRDISDGNLMYKKNDLGQGMGVLNDFDFATFEENEGPGGNQRTGAIPFMARELLTPHGLAGQITHVYRFEVESFVWVLVWVCLRFRKGQERKKRFRYLDTWMKADEEQCRKEKADFMDSGWRDVTASPSHKKNWRLAMMLMKLLHSQSGPVLSDVSRDSEDDEEDTGGEDDGEEEEEEEEPEHQREEHLAELLDGAVFNVLEATKEKCHTGKFKRRVKRRRKALVVK